MGLEQRKRATCALIGRAAKVTFCPAFVAPLKVSVKGVCVDNWSRSEVEGCVKWMEVRILNVKFVFVGHKLQNNFSYDLTLEP